MGTNSTELLTRLSRRFSVERMTPNRMEELCLFFKEAYADQPIAHLFQDSIRMKERWRWLNEAYPAPSSEADPLAWVCVRQRQLVGHFGALPALAVIRGRTMPICWGRDLIVAPEARQGGVGPLLILSVVKAVGSPFLIAGLNEQVVPIYRRLGFLDLGRIPLFLKVYQPDRLLDTLPCRSWPRLTRKGLAVLITAARPITHRRRRPTPGLTFESMDRFDDRFDRWWRKMEGEFPCVIRRTSETMSWRYQHHPDHRYTVLMAQDGKRELRGLAVVRHGRSRGLPAGFITELLTHPHDMEAFQGLLAEVERLLNASAPEPLAFIRSTVLQGSFEWALIRSGFLKVPSPIHWMMNHAQGHLPLQPMSRRSDWFLNAGDSDLDAV